jgi:hypothetical protein
LLDFVRDPALLLACCELNVFIATIEAPIFRDRERASDLHLRSDDFWPIVAPNWSHLSLHYQILTVIVASHAHLSHFNEKYVRRIFQLFESPDLNERLSLANLALEIGNVQPPLRKLVLQLALYSLAGYREQTRSALVLQPAMAILSAYLKERPPSEQNHEWIPIYTQYILPLATANHYALIQEDFGQIIDLFLTQHPQELASITWQSLFRSFPVTRCKKAVAFLQLITQALIKTPLREVWSNMRQIFSFYARCAGLLHLDIATASFVVWDQTELEPLIIDNANLIFPLVYPVLTQALKEAWNPKLKNAVDRIMQSLDRIDSTMFQGLCRHHHPTLPPVNDNGRTWASLARLAGANNPEIGESLVLADIRRAFTMSETSTALAPLEPRPRQTPASRKGILVSKANVQGPAHPSNSPLKNGAGREIRNIPTG